VKTLLGLKREAGAIMKPGDQVKRVGLEFLPGVGVVLGSRSAGLFLVRWPGAGIVGEHAARELIIIGRGGARS